MKLVSSIEEQKYVEMYNDGQSTVKIGIEFNRAPGTVKNHLNKLGIMLRSNRENSKKYYIKNEHYFDVIDSEDKAYLLGWMYSDGYIGKEQSPNSDYVAKRLGLSVGDKDVEILELLRDKLKTNNQIHHYKTGKSGYKENVPYCRLLVSSNTLVDGLLEHGVVYNKSNIIKAPIDIPYDMRRHFIRGYMDGDGSISISHGKTGNLEFNVKFIATPSVAQWIADYFLENHLVYKQTKFDLRHLDDKVVQLRWGGNNQVRHMLDHLYNNSTYYLTRKHNRYLQLCEMK